MGKTKSIQDKTNLKIPKIKPTKKMATTLLGETLKGKSGEIKTSEALTDKKALAIYFSAHWCPPCRGFTPKLAEWYKNDLSDKGLEVVFVSWDKDESQFDSYYNEMPWLALPFDNKEKQKELGKKYKVQGIPCLVVVDPETGNTITTDGRTAVTNDPKGEKLPWHPPTKEEKKQEMLKSLGDTFVDNKGGKFTKAEKLSQKDYIGIYFSAHWCPPCRGFTPKLAEYYNNGLKDKMEIIFASGDRSDEDFNGYFAEMPWLALPYSERKAKEKLSEVFDVTGIPCFVVLDKDFNTVTTDGRGMVTADPTGKDLPEGWKPKPWDNPNTNPEFLDGEVCIVYMGENEKVNEAMKEVAKEHLSQVGGEMDDMKYRFYLTPKGPVENQLRTFTETQEKGEFLMVLDLSDEGAFYTLDDKEITKETILGAIDKYQAKSMTKQIMNR